MNITRDQIVEQLQTKVVMFKYRKADGTERTAKGTLHELMLPETKNKSKKVVDNKTNVTYYDVESEGWRSFKVENFIGFM